jgi:hypothetical protein
MKIIGKFLMAGIVGILFFPGLIRADGNPPAEGGVLPAIDLAVPQDAEYQKYLGIGGGETFTIPEIKADVVLIEIFSMY